MIWLKAHLLEIYAGAPAWAWLLVAGILLFENWLANSKYKANSTIQLVLGWLGYVPVIGPLLRSRTVAVTVTEEVKPGPSGPVSLKLLPFLLLAAGLSACATARVVGYDAVTAMSHWAQNGAEELPPSCKAIQEVALKSGMDRASFDKFKLTTRARCAAALKVIDATVAGLQTASDGIADLAKGQASPKDLTAWIVMATDLYRNLIAVLDPLGVKLPEVP